MPVSYKRADLPVSPCFAAHFLQQRSNAVVRKELAAHLHQQLQLLTGYTEFLQRGALPLLTLCLNRPPPPGATPSEGATITASEVRLCRPVSFASMGVLLLD